MMGCCDPTHLSLLDDEPVRQRDVARWHTHDLGYSTWHVQHVAILEFHVYSYTARPQMLDMRAL